MDILLNAPVKGKGRVEERKFGSLVDYFLFGLRSARDFSAVATQLGNFCHCTMTMLHSFSLSKEKLQARFPMAFAQFDFRGLPNPMSEMSVDKLNMVLFQNRTMNFDKSKSSKSKKGSNGTMDFVDDVLGCYAVNNRGVYLRRSKLHDVDYFVMIYAKKEKDAGHFAKFMQTFPLELTDYSDYIREQSPLLIPVEQSEQKNPTADVLLLRSVFDYAEWQIDDTMDRIRKNPRFVRA